MEKQAATMPATVTAMHATKATELVASRIRRQALQMACTARFGHPGGDLSAADILAVLYGRILKLNAARPDDPERDRFVLSKGHASAAFYATLAEAGFLSVGELGSFGQPMSRLSGHPSCTSVPGVETSTGALGHGLPVAVGMALAAKYDRASWRVFVLTGDGELQEGSNWEAAMFASHAVLDNLTVVVDRNRLQQGAGTEDTNRLESLDEKWRAFGWSTRRIDGHDHGQLAAALEDLPFAAGRPSCVIADTVKGKGVSFMEGLAEWHHRVPTAAELAVALQELEGART
jgi:transketolase